MSMAETVLKKILSGDITIFATPPVKPGIGFDYSWVDLTMEEANWLIVMDHRWKEESLEKIL